MANLTNAKIANTFKDLLQVNAQTSNSGIDGTLRQIQDGGGTAAPFAISTVQLNVTGQFALNGSVLTATADQLNSLAAGGFTALTGGNDTVLITMDGVSVSTATTSATVVVNPVLSLTEVDAATGSFNTKVSTTDFVAGTGSFTTKVSGVAAEFSGDVSANNVYAATNIFIGGAAIPNAAALTSVNTVITNLSSTMATSINTANTRITSVSDFAVALSGTLATSIGTANTRITSVSDFAVALSSTMATSINTANTRITSVSDFAVALSGTLATSIGTTNTRIAQTSTDLAASIGLRLPLAGGTLTGILSGTDVYVSALAVGTNDLLGKDIHIEKSAVADIQALTDGTNISIDFNVGQNFTVTLAGNRTLDNPANCVAGQVGSIFIVQDGTGSRTLAYGGNWDFTAGTAPTLSTDADAIDRLDYIVHTSTDVQAVLTKAYS